MAALDRINDRNYKKIKHPDDAWQILDGSLVIAGNSVGAVNLDWSRYLKVGKELCYFAFVVDRYYVLTEKKRVGYVVPPEIKWGMPIPENGGDDE